MLGIKIDDVLSNRSDLAFVDAGPRIYKPDSTGAPASCYRLSIDEGGRYKVAIKRVLLF